MGVNRGKQFEHKVAEAFAKVPDVSIDRLHDQTTRFKGTSANICDYIVYKEPYEHYIECKSTHDDTFSINGNNPEHKYGQITNKQWEGLLEKSEIHGVSGGIILWFIDRDVTMYIPIQVLKEIKDSGAKSIKYDIRHPEIIHLCGVKKRVFYDYDMGDLLEKLRWRFNVGREN